MFINAWLDSLKIFIPKNFKLFLLVTLKSVIEAYNLFLKYFWWFLLLVSMVYFTIAYLHSPKAFFDGVSIGLIAFYIYFLLLITRPSVKQKNKRYFFNDSIMPWFVIYTLITFNNIFQSLITYTCSSAVCFFIFYLLLSPMAYFSPFIIFTGLFLLDSSSFSFQNLVKAAKMVWYNYPVLFIAYTVFYLVFYGLSSIGSFLHIKAITHLVSLALLPIPICFFTNIYIKKLHDQFTLYFPKKGL